jgi:ubiquitin C-terminal hydrolase
MGNVALWDHHTIGFFLCTMDEDHRNIAPNQGNNNNPMMISTGEGQLRNRTARTQQIMLTQYKAIQGNDEMPNAGLSNTGAICYSNAIFQALASCNHLTTFFDTSPQQNCERFVLYYAFSQVLHSMVRHQGSQQDVVNPTNFITPFLDHHSDFRDEQCEYSDACKILLFHYGTNMPFH